ncbi:MAG: CPBP family intramembrane metalloprotease [Ktedonobacterales bacterium]|nr:CPBP family intramembrane metalloprotease [Ktedonobacterales bacterium]
MASLLATRQNPWKFWVFLAGFFAIWVLRATVIYSLADTHITDPLAQQAFSNAIKALVWVVPVIIYLWYVDHTPPALALGLTTPLNRQSVLLSGAVIAIYLLGIVVFQRLGGQMLGATNHPLLALTLVSTVVSSFFEEVLFRGFVLAQLRRMVRFWPANVLTACLFTLTHWPNWVWTHGWGYPLVHSGAILILALVLGWLVRATNSLWPSITLHSLNNVLASLY